MEAFYKFLLKKCFPHALTQSGFGIMFNMMDKLSNMYQSDLPSGMQPVYLFWYHCMEARNTLSVDEFFHSFVNLHAHRINKSFIKVVLQINIQQILHATSLKLRFIDLRRPAKWNIALLKDDKSDI